MDWLKLLEPLQTFGTSFLYPALKLLLKLCYIVTIPLRYPIYYLFNSLVFLLSPIWHMLHSISSTTLAVAGWAAKLKYLYIYFAYAAIIGICAGCVLYGTSSLIFVTLGVDASQDKHSDYFGKGKALPPYDEDQESHDLDSNTRSGDRSSKISAASSTSRRAKSKQQAKDDTHVIFERQWKLLRSSEKPKRRRRGLLSQTIHEESSSDYS
ncbi:uncharacterized protein F4812DRAFT_458943 [Daldinia caldariorum]|uniref:uncharacterized protein n=1 Tax=Daldinia caldariorum TaxID=326644 RepID=UPI0020081273|nr:uncharacterized protein F4812DRAFT_458943 [Daldinia caldariorum]KAI1468513.1 hypothetical protein F4812DRAFT_458943 [Daldinia caldariorum]